VASPGAAMIVNVAYTLVFNTGLLPDACRAWKSRAIAGKTWAQFKIDFSTAHREFCLTNQTAQHSGFYSASVMIEQGREETMQCTVNAISQLATATASDRGTVSTLTTTNAKLAMQLEAAQAQIAQLKDEITALKNKIKPAWQGKRPQKTTINDSYCWSHGYQVAKSHKSATCNMKKSGHKDAVTKNNPMVGVQWGKEQCGGGAKVIDDTLNHFALYLDCTPSFTEVTTNDKEVIDSGCTSNFLSATAPHNNTQEAHVPLSVDMPNGTIIQSSHTCDLLLADFPPQAQKAHILPGLVHNSFISVGQLCNNGCNITFTQEQITISRDGK
jgi:hypothetical protein